MPGSLRDTDVRRTIFIAAIESILETHENLNIIFSKLNLERVRYFICSDIKLINIITGIQSSSSKHPCPYCNSSNIKDFDTASNYRTIGSNKQSALAFETAGSVKKDAKLYTNCINQPLLTDDDNALIIDICVPPELHLMQGIVKHIYDNMAKDWPGVSVWLDKIHVKQKDYHHGAFVGNDCRKLLKNTDLLQSIAEEKNIHTVAKYVHIFRCLNKVIVSGFGMTLDSQFESNISEFKDVYVNLGISITPKVHILVNHVPYFLNKHNRPLGWYSEQALESTHYDFSKNCWEKQRFKRQLGHPDYAKNLKRAVIVYSSRNLS